MTPQEEVEIREQLRALAEDDAGLEASAALEARLLAAFRGRRRTAPRSRKWLLAAAAASLALGATLFAPRPVPETTAPASADGEFLPLTYGDPLADVDAVRVVRVSLDRSALASYGWPAASDAANTLNAELLVGQDGLARGIRFVN